MAPSLLCVLALHKLFKYKYNEGIILCIEGTLWIVVW